MINMIFIAMMLVMMSTGFAEAEDVHRKTRAPRIIEYREPGGLFTASRRLKSEQFDETNERPIRQEAAKSYGSQEEQTLHYKPFSSAPMHIKNLIYQAYQPQEPYVDPHSFFYKNYVGLPSDFLSAIQAQDRRPVVEEKSEPMSTRRSSIVYRTSYAPQGTIEESTSSLSEGMKYRQAGKKPTSTKLTYGPRSNRNSEKSQAKVREEETYDMPAAIQTLLQYQSQIPYNVLANQINFEAKKPFIPQPLPAESKAAQYPSKIFYIKADGSILDHMPSAGIGGGKINYENA